MSHFLTWNKHLLDVNIRACRLDEVTHCQGWWHPSSFHESTGQCYHGPCDSLRYDSVLLFQVSPESAHRLFFQTNHIVSFLKHFLKVLETPDPWWSFCNRDWSSVPQKVKIIDCSLHPLIKSVFIKDSFRPTLRVMYLRRLTFYTLLYRYYINYL